MSKIKKDQILGIAALIIAAFYAFHVSKLPPTSYVADPGPKMFPMAGCLILGICGILLIIHPSKAEGKALFTKEQWLHCWLLFGIYVLYLVLLWLVGFTYAVPVILLVLSYVFSFVTKPDEAFKKRIVKTLIYTVVLGAAVYVLYVVVLDAQLPGGILFR